MTAPLLRPARKAADVMAWQWLAPVMEMAAMASGNWPPSPEPGPRRDEALPARRAPRPDGRTGYCAPGPAGGGDAGRRPAGGGDAGKRPASSRGDASRRRPAGGDDARRGSPLASATMDATFGSARAAP